MFNPKRLSQARKRRRLTARSLADRADVAADTITRLEKGSNQPDEATVLKLANVLGYPLGFFYGVDPEDIDTNAVSFRSFSKMSAKEKDAALEAGSLGLQLSAWVEQNFSLPTPDLLDLSYEDSPEAAANALRNYWGLGERPIGNLLGLLETKGIRIFSLSENTASVNAFSFWRDDKPFIFLNNFKTAESSIFDTAHELAHLVMHRHGGPRDNNYEENSSDEVNFSRDSRSVEREADSFASAFLMPENDVRARVPRFLTASVIIQVKARWRVSAMAMAHRLRDLGLLTDWQYKSICIELTKRGYRTSEPIGIERETSAVWRKILNYLWSEKKTKADIAKILQIPLDELEGLIWNLAAVNDPPPHNTAKNQLRVVQ